MDEYDVDADGRISGEELAKCPAVRNLRDKYVADAKIMIRKGGKDNAVQRQLDEDGVTVEMIQQTIQGWLDHKVGRVGYFCNVFHNGKPFGGAKLRLVPERFLGSGFREAVGIVEANGNCNVSVPDIQPRGITVGFYRVEITKDGEDIPVKFNKETIFGAAVSGPVVDGSFNLKY